MQLHTGVSWKGNEEKAYIYIMMQGKTREPERGNLYMGLKKA